MPGVKIQLRGQFALDRDRGEPISLQIARQLQEAIEAGRVVRGARPSTRSLASRLGVSRNTVLTAYAELTARGLVRAQRGSGVFVSGLDGLRGFDLKRVMRDAQYPLRRIECLDQDGSLLYISY
jgi:DNA-binding transcriptional regulator YhcF (GntR family)